MWVQDANGEWYGEVCPEDDSIVPRDFKVMDAASDIAAVASMYEETIGNIFAAACAPGDVMCEQASQVIPNLLQGEIPDVTQHPEVLGAVQAGGAAGAMGAQAAM